MADNDIRYCRVPLEALERWQLIEDVITNNAKSYLPILNEQDTSSQNAARNRAYRDRAVFYNVTGFTLAGLLGLAFRNHPQTKLGRLEYLIEDADGANVGIVQQAQSAVASVLSKGRHGLYVDFSSELKRPLIKAYLAEDIINWRTKAVGGKEVLSLVVLKECVEESDNYALVHKDQWRELFLDDGVCKTRIWQLPAEGEGQEPIIVPIEDTDGNMVEELVLRSSKSPLDFIPFVFIGSENNDASIDESPLYSLASLNLAHYRNSADYEDSVFYCGQAQPWMSGLDVAWRDWLQEQKTMYVGSRNPILLPVAGQMGFAQPLPNQLVKEAMDQKEQQMLALGARLIERQKLNKTATQVTGEREASTSILASCVINTSAAYEDALLMCSKYLDADIDVDFQINQDFTELEADAALLAIVLDSWQRGVISKPDIRDLLRRNGTIRPDRTDEMIDSDIKADPPPPIEPPKSASVAK